MSMWLKKFLALAAAAIAFVTLFASAALAQVGPSGTAGARAVHTATDDVLLVVLALAVLAAVVFVVQRVRYKTTGHTE